MKFKQRLMTIKHNKTLFIMATSFALLSTPTYADWGVGMNINNEPHQYKDSDNKKSYKRLQGFLNLQHRGEKFNMDRDISYDFTSSNKYAVEAFATFKNQGYKAKDNKTFKGMDERKTSVDIGGRLIAKTGLGPLVFDVTKDVHASKGVEANIKLGGIPPHAPRHWTGQKTLSISPVASLRYQSDKVVDYYYGVKSSEATAARKAHKGKSAVTPFIGLEAQANITPRFTIDGGLGVAKLAKSVRNSSLTTDRKYQPSVNVGFTYWF